ncbi:ectodysplasin-A receptor-associated adapter protein [Crotalus adamanteus]|uniref:Ectodysplasin-A receptor-associated adapter protein n=1 Tax=Crotalus adamanteus TaxID=8729 RepID=A0AAW1CBC2_CROAD
MRKEADQATKEPVEDTDPSTLSSENIEKYPVQDTALPKDEEYQTEKVTLEISSINITSLTSDSGLIHQPEEDDDTQSSAGDSPRALKKSCTEDCSCSLCTSHQPIISDLLNDEDLLYMMRIKLDPSHPTHDKCEVKQPLRFWPEGEECAPQMRRYSLQLDRTEPKNF